MTHEPTRSVEVERTYDVDVDAELPDWTRLAEVASVDAPEPRELDARYYDSADGALARARVALRRREGGPDAGWHVKISRPDGRHEWHWPLAAGDADSVPEAIADAVSEWAQGPFTPLARIRNSRIAYQLRDAEGTVLAEAVDDRVRATDERAGVEREWREWEVELAGPASGAFDADGFFAAVETLVAAQGARPTASDSKLARALGR